MKPKTKLRVIISLFFVIVLSIVVYIVVNNTNKPPIDNLTSDTETTEIQTDNDEKPPILRTTETDTLTETDTEYLTDSGEEQTDEEIQEEVINSVYEYSDWELDLLARLIYSEGGTESYQTQLMIGSVVMNRVDDPYFPDTISEVIYQENQFSVTTIPVNGVIAIDRPADEEAKEAALEVLTYGSVLPPKVQVFYHKSVTNNWVNTRQPYGTYDNTTFAYIHPKEDC